MERILAGCGRPTRDGFFPRSQSWECRPAGPERAGLQPPRSSQTASRSLQTDSARIAGSRCHKDLAPRSARRASCHVARRNVLPQASGLEQVRPAHPAWSAIRSITGGAMVEVPEVAFPRSGGADRSAPSLMPPGSPSADLNLATREWICSGPAALSEARRASNRARIGLVSELRCECTRPDCTQTLPSVAGMHRSADQLLVAPAHSDGGVVARAADRFFVIESRGHSIRHSRREKR